MISKGFECSIRGNDPTGPPRATGRLTGVFSDPGSYSSQPGFNSVCWSTRVLLVTSNEEMDLLRQGPTKVVDDRRCPAARNAGDERRQRDDRNDHKEFPAFRGQFHHRRSEFSPTLLAHRNVLFDVFVSHRFTVTRGHILKTREVVG